MTNTRPAVVLFVLLTTSVIFVAKGNEPKIEGPPSVLIPSIVSQPETEFPQLSTEVNYADVKKRMEWLADTIQKGNSFHRLFDSPGLEEVRNVPVFENSLMLYYRKSIEKQFYLGSANVQKRSPNTSPAATISFHNNGIVGYYDEFLLGRNVTVRFNDTGKLRNINFSDLIGQREIEFGVNENVLSDTYKKLVEEGIRICLEGKQQVDAEIRESIAAGYTDVQKKLPKEWLLQLPEKLDDETIRNQLTKIEEYRQAVIAGDALPLVNNGMFVRDDARPHVKVSYSSAKVAFVGVYDPENFRSNGFFMVFDEYFRLTKYVEGEITFDQNLTGYEVAKTAKLHLRDLPIERNRRPSGLEITFHSTGYPSSYKTIVRNELIGRQIEWDEKGNVISDIDTSLPSEPIIESKNEATVSVFIPSEWNEDAAPKTSVKRTTITISKADLRLPYKHHPLPKASNRWIIVVSVHVIVIVLLAILWWIRRKRKI